MAYRNRIGTKGEQLAVSILEGMGYRILVRNYRCRMGEVDVICCKGDELHFVEVKTRLATDLQYPAEAVDARKQARIKRIAKYYMISNGMEECIVVFDVIGVEIEYLAGCF